MATMHANKASTGPIDLRAILPADALDPLLIARSGDQDSLSLAALLREGLLAAASVRAQADAMDGFKERLKALAKQRSTQSQQQQEQQEEVEGIEAIYLLMLRLYLDPRAAALKKAAHRIMAQSVALANSDLEARVAARFVEGWAAELRSPNKEGEEEEGASSVALQVTEELADFGPTRRALCASIPSLQAVGLYCLRALARAVAPLAAATTATTTTTTEAGTGGTTGGTMMLTPAEAQRVELALVALKAMTGLASAWRLETASTSSPSASLLAQLVAADAGCPAVLVAAVGTCLGSAMLPYEAKNQAALVLALLALDSASPSTSPAALARTLACCFFPPSPVTDDDDDTLQLVLHPAFHALPATLGKVVVVGGSVSPSVASEARLSLARAVLIAADMRVLVAALVPPSPSPSPSRSTESGSQASTLMGGPILALLLDECQSPLPPSRLLAFMLLEAWLAKALDCCRRPPAPHTPAAAVAALGLPAALRQVANLLFWNWETSNKKVATVVPQAFDRLVQLLRALEEDGVGGVGLSIAALATTLGQQAPTRRSRYAGLKVLLPVIGPHELLKRCPNLVESLLTAITAASHTAAPATRLLLLVVRMLMPPPTPTPAGDGKQKKTTQQKAGGDEKGGKADESNSSTTTTSSSSSIEAVRALWLRPVARALLHPARAARTRIADHLLQEIIAADPPAALALLAELRQLALSSSSSNASASASSTSSPIDIDDRALWALLSVAEVARNLGGLDASTSQRFQLLQLGSSSNDDDGIRESPMVTLREARRGCLCGDGDVRLAALRMLAASPKTTTLLERDEQALVEEALSISLKAPMSGQRHGLVRAVRPLFLRYHEVLRVGLAAAATAEKKKKKKRQKTKKGHKGEGGGSSSGGGDGESQGVEKEEEEDRRAKEVVAAAERAIATVARILCEGLYPGTNVSRDAASLEVLALLLSTASGPPTVLFSHEVYRRALAPVFASDTAVCSLLNLFLAPWERTRRQAFDLLAAFPPGPLPGLSAAGGSVAPAAVHWAKQLTLSARRGESEAGALMLRLLFRVYVLNSNDGGSNSKSTALLLVSQEQQGEASGGGGEGGGGCGRVLFLRALGQLIARRLDGFEEGLAVWSSSSGSSSNSSSQEEEQLTSAARAEIVMVFGAIQAARYVLEEAATAPALPSTDDREAWAREVNALVGLLERAMEVSLRVIGTSKEGLPESLLFEDGHGKDGEEEEQYMEEQALHTAGPGLVVDCRGHLIRSGGAAKGAGDDGGEGEDEGDEGGGEDDTRKRLIVGGWMMAKEAGACLAEVVRQAAGDGAQGKRGGHSNTNTNTATGKENRAPQAEAVATTNGEVPLSSSSSSLLLLEAIGGAPRIDAVGRALLRALGRMKHMGGIQCTQAALLAVTRALILSSSSSSLSALPRQWMDALLDRLRNPRQHFVLRRSAGLASGFLAIAGAEPHNKPAVLLPALMSELLRLARAGEGSDWRTRIHALNVLRLLLLDAGPSREVSQGYMAQAMAVVLEGFRDPRWAVRNSALMVFGALVNAAVGSGKNALGSSAASASTSSSSPTGGGPSMQSSAHDFLRRHPDFLRIVAAELRRSLVNSSAAAAAASLADASSPLHRALAGMGLGGLDVANAAAEEQQREEAGDGAASPSLFPLILLLSRLRPPTEQLAEDETGSSLDLSLTQCLPHVARCACLPDGLMRLTAARAFASLVGTSKAPAIVAAILSALPASASAFASGSGNGSSNAVHGLLLMANALLRGLLGVLRGLKPPSSADGEGGVDEEAAQVAALVAPLLQSIPAVTEDKAWLAGSGMPCPPIRQEALQLLLGLHHLLALASPFLPSMEEQRLQRQRQQQLAGILQDAIRDLLQQLRLLPSADDDNNNKEGEELLASTAPLPAVPGLAALVAWATRWHLLLLLLHSPPTASSVDASLERCLARWLRYGGAVEPRRESLRVLLLLLCHGPSTRVRVDLGEGWAEDEAAEEARMMEQALDMAGLSTSTTVPASSSLWRAAGVRLVAQLGGEANPNLLKGQFAALCLLLGGRAEGMEASSPSPAAGAAAAGSVASVQQLWGLVSRAAAGGRLASSSVAEEQEQQQLLLASSSSEGGEIAARGLELMGHLLSSIEAAEAVGPKLGAWLGLVEAAALPERSPALRLAALQSVRASGLLQRHCPGFIRARGRESATEVVVLLPFVVRALLAALRLAQDDDDGVRQTARGLLSECLVDASGRSRPATACLDRRANQALAGMAAADPAAARTWIEGVVSILSARAEGLAAALEAHIPSSSPSGSLGLGLPQQIFRPEPDNVFEEPAVVGYWAARSLIAALAEEERLEVEAAGGGGFLSTAQALLVAPLLATAGGDDGDEEEELVLARAMRGSAWIGGMTNHPDVLPKLFSALLGAMLLAVLAPSSLLGQPGLPALARLLPAAAGEEHEARGHVLVAWAMESVAAVLWAVREGGDGTVGGRARRALACVRWEVVDRYAPFERPEA